MTTTRQTKPYQFEFKVSKNKHDILQVEECVLSVNPPPITSVIFKGGGARVFLDDAAIQVAEAQGVLNEVQEYSGSSSGAFWAVLQAIPFYDPKKREKAFDDFYELEVHDSMGDSLGWNIYKIISLPLYLVSKPLSLLSKGMHFVAKQFNKIQIVQLLGIPLNIVSTAVKIISDLLLPDTPAILYNLITAGGMYRGEKCEKGFKKIIHENVKSFIDEFLQIHQSRKTHIEQELIAKKIYIETNGQHYLTAELTFNHFVELSQLFDGAFKQILLTGVRLKDLQIVLFRKGTEFGDLPIYKALRISTSLPRYFISPSINGNRFMDGGAINNCPVEFSANFFEPNLFQRRFGITEDMSKLVLRVEYPHSLDFLFKRPNESKNILNTIYKRLLQFIVYGVDTFQTEEMSRNVLRKQFPHRVLQLEDFGITLTEFGLSKTARIEYIERSKPRAQAYFEHRREEKVAIIHFNVLPGMDLEVKFQSPASQVISPREAQIRLLVELEDKSIPTEKLFWITGKNCDPNIEAKEKNDVLHLLDTLRLQLEAELRKSEAVRELSVLPDVYLERLDTISLSYSHIFNRIADEKLSIVPVGFKGNIDKKEELPQSFRREIGIAHAVELANDENHINRNVKRK
jgi:predicted acylesterase/phospholipase RssA